MLFTTPSSQFDFDEPVAFESFPHSHYSIRPSRQQQLERQALLLAQAEERERIERQRAAALALAYEEERRRQLQHQQQQALHQAILERAIQEEEERRELERALTYRQEMIRRARQAEMARARERKLQRFRQHQLEEMLRRKEEQEQEREEEESQVINLFETLFESLLPSLPLHPQQSSLRAAPSPTATASPSPIDETLPSRAFSSVRQSRSEATKEEVSTAASSDEEEESASIIQQQFRRHLARRQALEQLSELSSSFSQRQANFVTPTSFTFQSSPTPPFAIPRLAFGSANSNFLSYEDFLVSLLSRIDEVQSNGDRQVKKERKELVRKVEKELARLDEMKEKAWEEQQTRIEGVEAQDSSFETSQPHSPSNKETTLSPESSLSTPHLDEDDEDSALPDPLPALTQEALSSVPTTTSPLRSSSGSPSDSGSSTTSSTLSVSSHSSQVDQYIFEMLKRAQKLGEQVEKLEVEEARPPTPLKSVAVA